MEKDWTPDIYSDVPVAYAVYKLLFAKDSRTVRDTEYVFVNEVYCEMAGLKKEELLGKSFFSVYENGDPIWMTYCTKAYQEGKAFHDCIYAPEIGHWLDFTIMPLKIPGYVAYTFTNVDLDRAQQLKMKREYTTNDVILRISKILNGEDDYETAMNHALRELSRVLCPDRLYILETDCKTFSNTFEWCAPGVKSELATLQHLDYARYIGSWERFLEKASSVIIEDIEVLKEDDPVGYKILKRQGIERLIATPIYHLGRLIGYLCADNYEWDSRFNTVAAFETVSYFLAAKLSNHRLVEELDHLSRYDALTGLLNRNAFSLAVDTLMHQHVAVGVVYADVNGLKEINDELGHQAGDKALKRTADLLADCCGREHAYRVGGDEFIVLMPEVAKQAFEERFARLHMLVEGESDLSLAVGADWLDDAAKLDEAISRTDRRMYRDKVAHYEQVGKKELPRHEFYLSVKKSLQEKEDGVKIE